jgi:hypothetical protein
MPKTTLPAVLLGLTLTLQAADISEVPSSRVTREVPAFSPGGRIQVHGGEALVNVSSSDGTPTKGDLVVLFDPATRRFLWQNFTMSPRGPFDLIYLNALSFDKHQALVSTSDSVAWWRSGDRALEVRASTETAKNLDDAFAKALSDLSAGWETRYAKADYPNRRIVAFRDEAEMRDFAIDPTMPNAASWPTIENVTRVDQGYQITLHGMWFGEVTIGDDLGVKEKFHRVPDPK